MAALNFPSNPSTNQIYTSDEGTVFKYNGTGWIPELANNAISTAKLAADAVTEPKINGLDGGTDGQLVASDGDDGFKYVNPSSQSIGAGSVTTDKLANDAVTQAKVANDAIGGAQLKISGTAANDKYVASDGTDFKYVDAPSGGSSEPSATANAASKRGLCTSKYSIFSR